MKKKTKNRIYIIILITIVVLVIAISYFSYKAGQQNQNEYLDKYGTKYTHSEEAIEVECIDGERVIRDYLIRGRKIRVTSLEILENTCGRLSTCYEKGEAKCVREIDGNYVNGIIKIDSCGRVISVKEICDEGDTCEENKCIPNKESTEQEGSRYIAYGDYCYPTIEENGFKTMLECLNSINPEPFCKPQEERCYRGHVESCSYSGKEWVKDIERRCNKEDGEMLKVIKYKIEDRECKEILMKSTEEGYETEIECIYAIEKTFTDGKTNRWTYIFGLAISIFAILAYLFFQPKKKR